jgi:hypothetical protein
MKVEAEALGRRVARRYVVRGVRPDVHELAKELGVQISEQQNPPPAQPGLRSEYRPQPPQIILYREPLDQLAAAIHANQRFDLLSCRMDDLHIAHELFHHLEAGGRFGPLRPDEIEAAAHAFAQALLDTPFHPTEVEDVLS